MLTTLVVTVSLFAAALPQDPARPDPSRPAAGTSAPRIHWQRSLADALHVQKETGLPLLVVVNMDGEVFNDRFASTTYKDPAFVESTRGYVCVVASPDRHTERDYDALGNRIECPRFGGCTCAEHIVIEPELFQRFFGGKRNAPRHVGVSPDGKILFDRYLDASMQTAIDAIQKHRGAPKQLPDPATSSVGELLRRRDALARAAIEARYRTSDDAARRSLLEAAATASNEPIDLLRMGLRDKNGDLAGLAALAIAKTAGADALIDIEDALARITDPAIRQALVRQLEELGKTSPEARRLASHYARNEAAALPEPWGKAWRPAFAATDRQAIEQALDRAERDFTAAPTDASARLRLAIGQAALGVLIANGEGRGADLWLADAQQHAQQIADEALAVEQQAVLAVAAWYLGDADAARRAMAAAMAKPSPREPDAWLAAAFLDVSAQLTAQAAFARAEADATASLAIELERAMLLLDRLEQHGLVFEKGPLAAIALLEFAGLRREAQVRLARLADRFPGSMAVHDRFRTRLLVDLGPELMTHEYARFVTRAKDGDKAVAQWFAGYAALVAGDQLTKDGQQVAAANAYGDAQERLLQAGAGNPDYDDTARHYAVLALAGRASIRAQRGEHAPAVEDLLRAAELRPESLDATDGLERKPRAIAGRVARELRSAGRGDLADRLQPMLEH
jgi:hypothetical protein